MHRTSLPAALLAAALALTGAATGCDGAREAPPPEETPAPPAPDPATVAYEAPPPPLPRLTATQYRNAIRALFGDDVVVPPDPELDVRSGGLLAVGAGVATVSPRGAENYERAAYAIAAQVLAPERRDRVLPCPAETADRACLEAFAATQARRVWRRPPTAAEVERLVTIGAHAGETLGDALQGFEFTLAALLQSPHFLFRRELGDGPDGGPFDGYAMASRLAFLLWNTTPDDALLDAAEAGELTADDTLRARAEAMLDDPRARDGVLQIFVEWLGLDGLDGLRKDPTVFTAMSPELAPAARRETLSVLEELVFERDADFRDFIDGRETIVDRKLAALYGVRAPAREGFAPVELPEDTGRRGFLGQVSFLAVNAHPVSTSATLRGKFIREKLLCQIVPPPPSDVDTSIPAPSGNTRTLRERVAEHLTNPTCTGCHLITDPIGLAFENFDGLGAWRDSDHGERIDPAGDLDGVRFQSADELAGLIATHEDFPVCAATYLVRYGTGTVEGRRQRALIEALAARFVAADHRYRALLLDFITSPAFRVAGPIAEEE
ncbi:MAG: DUF1592 domain-containing protein [bacterium]